VGCAGGARMNAIEVATLEEVTKDDETPAEPDQVDGLSAVASGGSPEAQKEMADWLAARLSVESIPVRPPPITQPRRSTWRASCVQCGMYARARVCLRAPG
jgi:hypothetical protein